MNDDQLDDARLRELAGRLGAAPAERLDVERIAATVVERLRQEPIRERPARSPWWGQPAWLRVAAAVVLVVGVGLVARGRFSSAPRHPSHYVREDLEGLSAAQLREVLGTLDQTLDDGTHEPMEDDDLNDLTTEQLQALLRSLEG